VAHLRVQEWGDPAGPPVVCAHGLSSHGGRFFGLAQHLPGRRVIAVDLRGHGASTWEAPWGAETHVADLLETADALDVRAATWIGHSFGGRLVAELARTNPDRAERAVLLDPAMHIEPTVATERAELLLEDVSFGSVDEAVDARHADPTLLMTPRETIVREAEAHLALGDDGRYRWRYSRAAAITAWSVMAAPAPAWPECPTLVVIGEGSWIANRVPRLPHLTRVPVPGGHSVLWDAPEETAHAVARFLGA
jgi:lipase